MAPRLTNPDALGDIHHRDATLRNRYQRANGPVVGSEYTLAGNTVYHTVAHVSSLSGAAVEGSYAVFTKAAGAGTTAIDTQAQAATLTVQPSQTVVTSDALVATRGNLALGTAALSASATTGALDLRLAAAANVTFSDNAGVFARFGRASIATGADILLGTAAVRQANQDLSLQLGAHTGNVHFQDPAGAPFLSASKAGVRLGGNASIFLQDFRIGTAASDLNLTLPLTGNAGQVNVIGPGGTFMTIAESGLYVAGALTVDSDMLATADLNVTGETTLYGDVSVLGNLALGTKQLLLGSTSALLSGAGLFVGNSVATPAAALTYQDGASFGNAAAFRSSVPLVYADATTTTDVSGAVTVFSSADRTTRTQLTEQALGFNDRWRIRYDGPSDSIVFEYFSPLSSTWLRKFVVQSN